MKRFLLEIQIGLLVIVGVALVLATGYLAYTGMTSILLSVSKESKPDIKLNLIQLLATDLEKAENGVRLYAYSHHDRDLLPYYKLITGIDDQINRLREEGQGSRDFSENMDTVSDLIGKKILLWNEMLPLYTIQQSEMYLDTISKELENKIESDSLRKSRGILKKLFQRQEKLELDKEKMVRDIEQAKIEDSHRSVQIRNKELELAEANSRLTMQFYDLVKRMEEEEYRVRKQKALDADRMADETYQWIGWFSLAAVLSLLLVILVITRYIRKSHTYQLALMKAKNEAENLAKAKEMFVANVSHELRTPMNVISGFVDQLLKKPQEEENGKTLQIIKSSTDHLVRIVNDILDFSKLESGKMKLEPVHFKAREVFNELLLLFQKTTREKNIQLEVEVNDGIPEVLFGDSIRLKQILINLTGNAIKFTSEGKVSVHVNALNQVAGHLDLTITVSDTGIGIANDKLDMIFEDFTQAESGTSQKFGGTGLGLSIVKKLIDLHDGKIKVHSKITEGTTFECQLPYKKGYTEDVPRTQVQTFNVPETIQALNILVVDDEPYNRKLVGTILKKWRVNFKEAESGEHALQVLKSGNFDVILMDNRMPGLDGLETSWIIRKSVEQDASKLAIVSFSAAIISKDQLKTFAKAGIHTSLPKPFTEEDLLKILLKLKNLKLEDVKTKKKIQPPVDKKEHSRIDLKQLYRVAGDDESFVIEMLKKFIESFDAGYKIMRDSINRKEFSMTGGAAHKLVSPCRHIGAEALLDILKEIEMESDKKNSTMDMKMKAEEARIEYEIVKKQILDHLQHKAK